jgi:excisionase family DNA binding protein
MSTLLLTVPEVAKMLRCSRWGVYTMVRDGRLPAVRLSSRRLLFSEDAVELAICNAEHQSVKTGAVRLKTYTETP